MLESLTRVGGRWTLLSMLLCFAVVASAAEIGQVKTSKGQVTIERDGRSQPGTVGLRLQTADIIKTGADGSVGITMDDESLLSVGPNSVLSLDRFVFDSKTNAGRFDAALNRGTLAVISGKIAKQTPDAMTVRTPTAVLGVRGTEFVVSAND
ncbi:MAG TPA: FecR domain-containing protein [Casimicrobiaceae bacterium]